MNLKLLVLSLCFTFVFSDYVQTVAKELTIYGVIAYRNKTEIQEWTCEDCAQYKLTDIYTFSYQPKSLFPQLGTPQSIQADINLFTYLPKSLFGYVGYSQNLQAIAIAFRGISVQDLQNIPKNINISLSDYPECKFCKVDTTTYKGIRLLSQNFIPALKKVVNAHPEAPIYVTGHSLGGALAALAAPIIKDFFPNNKLAQVITGGKPRVGNFQFANWYNSNIQAYRVVYKNDIVPHIPVYGPLQDKPSSGIHIPASRPVLGLLSPRTAKHQMSLRHHLANQEQHEQLVEAHVETYIHQGKEVWYETGWSGFYICQNEDTSCSNSIPKPRLNVLDHMPSFYSKITSTASEL